MEGRHFRDRRQWRAWLEKNHLSAKLVWLIYYKKHTGKPSVSYDEAVEEAICFGWIDGLVRTVDEERFMQRFTPRNPKSLWSETNIDRAERMIRDGKMTERGETVYREAISRGQIVPTASNFTVPDDLEAALRENPAAWKNFTSFPASAQLMYVFWVDSAKRAETRRRRIEKAAGLIAQNKRIGET